MDVDPAYSSISTYQTNMLIHGVNPSSGIVVVQRTTNDLLDSQNDTILAAQTDQGAALLHRLAGIVNLENSTVRRKLRSR